MDIPSSCQNKTKTNVQLLFCFAYCYELCTNSLNFQGVMDNWCPSFILLALTKLSKDLSASDCLSLFWSYVMTTTTATWQQTGSPKASSAAHPREGRELYMVMFICVTHTTSRATKGQEHIPQPHSVAPCNPWKPLSWWYFSGNVWREDGANLIPCCPPPTAGRRVTISLQLILHKWGLDSALSFLDSKLSWNTIHCKRQLALITSKPECV